LSSSEVAGLKVVNDVVDGLTTNGDRTSRGRAERKQQGHGEPGHSGQGADRKRAS
jgi:hypothetical protein